MERGVSRQTALDFRRPMQVTRIIRYPAGGAFPVCPQCSSTLEREYQNFCDRCGQRLGWRKLHPAEVIIRR